MASAYRQDTIENWVSDFCMSDANRGFSPAVREVAGEVLVAFLGAACAVRDGEPGDVEEGDLKVALLEHVGAVECGGRGARGGSAVVWGVSGAQLEVRGGWVGAGDGGVCGGGWGRRLGRRRRGRRSRRFGRGRGLGGMIRVLAGVGKSIRSVVGDEGGIVMGG